MTEVTYDQLSDAVSAISKIKLSPEDGVRFISVISAMYGTTKMTGLVTVEKKKRSSPKDFRSVRFGGHLKASVKDGPRHPKDLIEPLRNCRVILADDDEAALAQVIQGFQKSRGKVYREYPDGKWGLLSYPQPRLIEQV